MTNPQQLCRNIMADLAKARLALATFCGPDPTWVRGENYDRAVDLLTDALDLLKSIEETED